MEAWIKPEAKMTPNIKISMVSPEFEFRIQAMAENGFILVRIDGLGPDEGGAINIFYRQ
jgi:hypothetical protein